MIRSLLAALLIVSPQLGRAGDASGWITHPDATDTPVVLEFQREFTLDRVPAHLPVNVTADNRFVLYVNGKRVASGPSTGTLQSWRQSRVDLAPWLRPGAMSSRAVWNFGDWRPRSSRASPPASG